MGSLRGIHVYMESIWGPEGGYKYSQGLYRVSKRDICANRGCVGSLRGI